MVVPDVLVKCAGCRREAKTKLTPAGQSRIPQRWHRRKDEIFCADCWSGRFILRAIALPVASPLDAPWEELWKACRMSWALTTQASNWMMTELAKHDVSRTKDMEKLPPLKTIALYAMARKRFSDLPAQTIVAIEHAVQGKYRAKRKELLWLASCALPSFRYPVPFPVYQQSWQATLEDGLPVVSVRIGNAEREQGKGRYRVRLRAGHQFRRQLERFREIARGEAQQGELAVYMKGTALMVKMVAWFPRRVLPSGRTGQLLAVRTLSDALLVAVNTTDEVLWKYNGDHVRRWSEEHARKLQRWAEDSKADTRPVPPFSDRRSLAAAKYRDRMESACHEISAHLSHYAFSRHFNGMRYDDSIKSFCPQFPYFRLKQMLKYKLDELGLILEVVASGDPVEKVAEPLVEEEH